VSKWPLVAVGEIFEIARGGSPRPIDDYITQDPNGINWIMIADASEGSKYITSTRKRIRPEGVQRSRSVAPGDLLLTNSMSFGRPYIVKISGCIHDGWLVLSPRQQNVSPDFFYYLLGSSNVYIEFCHRAAGVTVKNLNIDLVSDIRIPLPSLPEQQRIADILDKADSIRRKRKQAIALTEQLLRSTFLEMFGDPVTNPKGWPVKPLGKLLDMPLRNGLSPATGGNYAARCLTLSAITRGRFDVTAVKNAVFAVEPWEDVRVDARDFLICRGNGNHALVGTGAFPDTSDPTTVFPDTMIAARIDEEQASRFFFASIWKTALVRQQIESGARTTNGTYKVNQGVIESISIPVPDIDRQKSFGTVAEKLSQLRKRHTRAADTADDLFYALAQRVFSNEIKD